MNFCYDIMFNYRGDKWQVTKECQQFNEEKK